MFRSVVAAVAFASGGCNQLFGLDGPAGDDDDGPGTDARAGDPGIDAAPGRWGRAIPIPIAATSATEDDPVLTADEGELLFARVDATEDIMSSRKLAGGTFPTAEPVVQLNSNANEGSVRLAVDPTGTGATIFFTTDREGMADVWTSRRTTTPGTWAMPNKVADLSSTSSDAAAAPCGGRTRFVVSSNRGGISHDLYEVVGGLATRVDATLTPNEETGPFLSEDCHFLYYASNTRGTFDLYVTRRDVISAPWSPPELITGLSTPTANEGDPWLSPDGNHILFASDAAGTFDIVEAFANP